MLLCLLILMGRCAAWISPEPTPDPGPATLDDVVQDLIRHYNRHRHNCVDQGCAITKVESDGKWVHVHFRMSSKVFEMATALNYWEAKFVLLWAKPESMSWCNKPLNHRVIFHAIDPYGREDYWVRGCSYEGGVHMGAWSGTK